jgi:hypothetical protein
MPGRRSRGTSPRSTPNHESAVQLTWKLTEAADLKTLSHLDSHVTSLPLGRAVTVTVLKLAVRKLLNSTCSGLGTP